RLISVPYAKIGTGQNCRGGAVLVCSRCRSMTSESQPVPDLEHLLEYLKQSRGFDFTAYKRPSLARRIDKRMRTIGVNSYGDYLDYLEVHPDEFALLFNAILINVSMYPRDTETFEYLRTELIPALLRARG